MNYKPVESPKAIRRRSRTNYTLKRFYTPKKQELKPTEKSYYASRCYSNTVFILIHYLLQLRSNLKTKTRKITIIANGDGLISEKIRIHCNI